MSDRELESVIASGSELRRKALRRSLLLDRSSRGSVLRLQALAGNAAVAGLVAGNLPGAPAPTTAPAHPAAPTPQSIGQALAAVSVKTSQTTVQMLEPWEIFRLVTANTPRKQSLYKQLKQAWKALEAAQRRLAAAEEAAARAAAHPEPAPAPAHGKHGSAAHKKAPDPEAARKAAAAAVEQAQKRLDAIIEELKKFILENNDLVRRLNAEQRSLSKSLARARAGLAALKQSKSEAAKKKIPESERAVKTLEQEQAALPKRREDAIAEVKAQIASTSFGPESVQRTVYSIEIEGETVNLYDRVDAYATKFENGLVEADHAVKATLDDVLARTNLSESNKKILRAISDNESGGAPWSSVNTYDRAVLTWGLVQWTGGSHSDLTAALTTIKTVAPDAFAERFQKYGIDIVGDQLVITSADGSTVAGDDAALKIQGSPTLSAVMSRAGLDDKIQEAEVAAAAEQQITRPLHSTFEIEGPPSDDKDDKSADPKHSVKKKSEKVKLSFSQVLTSEFVAGLFADRVVNAGAPSTKDAVARAVQKYVTANKLKPGDVATWAPALQDTLIALLSPFPDRVKPFGKRGCSKTPGSYSF